MSGFLRARGHWDQSAALHQSRPGRSAPGRRPARPGRAPLSSWASCNGRLATTRPPPPAWPGRWRCTGDLGDQPGQASVLNQLGFLQQLTGDYPAAAASQQQALALFRDLDDLAGQAAPSMTWVSCSS